MFVHLASMTQRTFSRLLRKYWVDQNGASAIEYTLLVALIAAVLFGVASYSGSSLSTTFQNADAGLSSALSSGQNGSAPPSNGTSEVGNSGPASEQAAPLDNPEEVTGSDSAASGAIGASEGTASGGEAGRFILGEEE